MLFPLNPRPGKWVTDGKVRATLHYHVHINLNDIETNDIEVPDAFCETDRRVEKPSGYTPYSFNDARNVNSAQKQSKTVKNASKI